MSFFIPKKEEDGFRYYGRWAGNPAGHKEDLTRCIAVVHESGRGIFIHQCQRKRGKGPNGEFCGIHNPEAERARLQKSHERYEDERWNADWARLLRANRRIQDLEKAIDAAVLDLELAGPSTVALNLKNAVIKAKEKSENRNQGGEQDV